MVYENHGFESDDFVGAAKNKVNTKPHSVSEVELARNTQNETNNKSQSHDLPGLSTIAPKQRDGWGNEIEFLFSCIAMSVGLGNVWRFPFAALENGGSAFLIPYLVVLFVVGRPIYYLEMIIGQFSSRGSAKVYDMVPAMRGIGYGQIVSVAIVSTYCVTIMATTLKYFWDSFQSPLPWTICKDEWSSDCSSSSSFGNRSVFALNNVSMKSSAELYFQMSKITIILKARGIIIGTGYGQVVAVFWLCTYYASTMAVITRFLIESFQPTLPWSNCKPDWKNCIPSGRIGTDGSNSTNYLSNTFNYTVKDGEGQPFTSSSEYYFIKEVLKEKDNIDDGIGIPDWKLVLCLLASWGCIIIILIKGVRSSGKASYFLAIFPYVGMGILLVRACTLPGASDGILYFIKPQWDRILDPSVWYAAVTQCFFSLSVCFGNIVMYASFNKFSHNVYRDSTIVAFLDTFTSLIAGCTIFAILGHLAYVTNSPDIGSVIKGGAGLAFISYPDAIAKFDVLPQLFSVIFFFMLFVLGVGSNIAMTSCVMTVIRDQFPSVKAWHAAAGVSVAGMLIGLVYVTPGGQFVLNLVDFFGASFIAYILAIAELITIGWIYGVNRLCQDTEFMTGRNPGLYWRICWGFLTPLLMIAILLYTFATYKPLTYKDSYYPDSAYAAGWTIAAFAILQLPIWCVHAIIKQKGDTWIEKIRGSFRPKDNWGPNDPATFQRYQKYRSDNFLNCEMFESDRWYHRIKRNVFG